MFNYEQEARIDHYHRQLKLMHLEQTRQLKAAGLAKSSLLEQVASWTAHTWSRVQRLRKLRVRVVFEMPAEIAGHHHDPATSNI